MCFSCSAQGCDQVAGDSRRAGRGPCPFLVTRHVRTLNSSPAPTHAYLRGTATANINQGVSHTSGQVLQCGQRGTQEMVGGSFLRLLLTPLRHRVCGPPPIRAQSLSWFPPLAGIGLPCFPKLLCLCLRVFMVSSMLICVLVSLLWVRSSGKTGSGLLSP